MRAHPLIEFSTLWHQENYAIFAVLDVSLDAKSEQFLDFFSHPTFESDTEFKTYVRKAQLLSMYAIPIDVQPSDALLTLSTCLDENRLVILARRQREGERLSSLRAEVQMAVRQ